MIILNESDSAISLLNESTLSLTNDQQKAIIQQFIRILKEKPNKDSVELLFIKVLNVLNQKDQFKLQLIDRDDPQYQELSKVYGYYSSYDTQLYVVLDKKNFLDNNFSTLNLKDLDIFLETSIHETIHFTCINHYQGFMGIWDPIFRSFIHRVFVNVAENYFDDFMVEDTSTVDPKRFVEDPMFMKITDAIYNSILINLRFRYRSLIKRYNDVMSTLYSKFDFTYSRFFDNVFINIIKLQQSEFSSSVIKLYRSIQKAYVDLYPELAGHLDHELFYQELLDLSEISCVLSNHYRASSKITSLIQQTLELIH